MDNKNVLVIAGSSQIGLEGVKLMLKGGYKVYFTSRKDVDIEHPNLFKYKLDVRDEESFIYLKEALKEIKFRAIVNNAGIVVTSPVEYLSDEELKKELDVNLFGLLRIIRHFSSMLDDDGRIINISSMATYGVYPFLSPYCLTKAAADILLRSYSNETGIKYVSVRPGTFRTKIWTDSIKNNEDNFKNFEKKYEKIGMYMLENARKNAKSAPHPIAVGKVVYKALCAKNPKCVVNVGIDAKLSAFAARVFGECLVNKVVRKALDYKSKG